MLRRLIIVTLACLLIVGGTSVAQQKFGYVNSQTILGELPDAQEAQKKLNTEVQAAQDSIDSMQKSLQARLEDYQKRQAMLTDAAKKEEEQKLFDGDQAIKQFQQVKFGQNGQIAQEREKLFAPIRDRIVKAIQVVAKEEKMQFILDKTPDVALLLYADPQFDMTYKVLDRLKRGK